MLTEILTNEEDICQDVEKRISILGFVAANLAWLVSLRTGAELSKGAVLFSVLSGIGAVLIGVLIYHEKANPYQLIGLALGVVAIAFLSMA